MSPPRRPLRKRRIAEASAAAEADALISLATDVLDDILIRLGLRDAVRTSALSRAWRRRWEALPSLDLDFPRLEGDEGAAPKGLSAVDGILLRCPGRIRRFRVDLDDLSVRRVHDWVLTLSRRGGVEYLHLGSGHGNFFVLHSSVFSCRTLAVLDLFTCEIPSLPPGFAGFPDLRKLTLVNVRLQEGGEYQLEEIVDTSPLLEELILSEVYIGGEYFRKWAIRAPNLRHLTICSTVDYGWVLEELPRLRSAAIDLGDYVGDRNLAKFLAGLVQVQKLLLVTFYAPSKGAKMPETLPCTFHNLKILKLYMHFCELPPIMLTLCLLNSAPSLEKLKIKIFSEEEQQIEANREFLNAQWTDGMCPSLQVVQMKGISWLSNEMSFMELILSKARLLRTLSISHGEKVAMSSVDALNELLRYRRASPQAQVLFQGKAEEYY